MSDSSAKGQPADSGRGDNSARRGHSEHMCCVIYIAPYAAAANRHGASRGINPCVFYRAKVADQTIVANSQASRVVTATSDGEEQTILSRKIHRVNDVRHVGTTGNEARLFVDHRVVHLPGFVVIFVTRFDQ